MPVGRLTLDDLEIVELEVDPTGIGVDAPLGSLGISSQFGIFQKTGTGSKAWSKLQAQAFPIIFTSIEESSNSSNSVFLNKITATTPDLPAGNYLLTISFKARMSSNDKNLETNLVHNGQSIYSDIYLLDNAGHDRPSHSYMVPRTMSGVNTIQFQFRVGLRGSNNAFVSQAVLKIEKVY